MKRLSNESKVLVILCLGLLVSAYFLFLPSKNSTKKNQNTSVGFVRPIGKDIRIKSVSELAWNAVARDASVYTNDKVFTGTSSRAQVSLKNNERFTVEPNSLIVISDMPDKQLIEFSGGGLFAEFKKGAKLFIKHKGKESEYSAPNNATIRLFASKQGYLKLVVLEGEAEVKRAESTEVETVFANSELEVSKPEAKPIASAITLLAPKPGEEIGTKTTEVAFMWDQSPSSRARVELSTDPEFQQIVAFAESSNGKTQINLPIRETYFWRVVTADASSVVSSFTLQSLFPPQVAENEPPQSPENRPSANLSPLPLAGVHSPDFLSDIKLRPIELFEKVKNEKRKRKISSTEETKINEPEKVTTSNSMTPQITSAPSANYWLWVGTGLSYQSYLQSVPSYLGEAKFRTASLANYHLQAGFIQKNWGADLIYKFVPWTMRSTSSTQISNGNSSWQSLSGDVLFRHHTDLTLNYRFGIQHHNLPFMYARTTEEINIERQTLTAASLGFDKQYFLGQRLRLDGLLRYQLPIASGGLPDGNFRLTPRLAFDGSIGTTYIYNSRSKFGIYLYGQFHDFQFEYLNSKQNQFSGSQTIFYSNLEFRYGFDF